MNNRVRTGIAGLDEILRGGILGEHAILVEGSAGTGKSILGLQFLVAGANQYDEPGVLLTFDVTPDHLYRDAANFGWDLRKLEKQGKLRVILASAKGTLEHLQEEGSPLDRMLKEIGARRVVIDSVTMLRDLVSDRGTLRQTVRSMVRALKREGITSILINETDGEQPTSPIERSSVDAIISLSAELYDDRDYEVRRLRVVKARGQFFISGSHTFKIVSGKGIDVFPRVPAAENSLSPAEPVEQAARESVGIPALDEMLGGGTYRGAATMVAGSTGTGKSLLGLQFLLAGIKSGEKVLIVNLEETQEQIIRNASTLGFDLTTLISQEKLRIINGGPAELDLNEHVGIVMREIRTRGVRRLLIDSLSAYEATAKSEHHYREIAMALITFCKQSGVSAILTQEISELTGPAAITGMAVSILVDSILLLRYFQIENRIARGLMVLKSRGSSHDDRLREFAISAGGIRIGDIDPGRTSPLFSFK